jgi:predicted nucleotidyltransferase
VEEAVFRVYARSWRKRQEDERRHLAEKARAAGKAAERLAQILVREYGAREVWLFGSLARGRGFRRHSDIDLAATGLPAREFFSILSRLNAATEFNVDLVDLDACPTWLAEAVRREGRLLAVWQATLPSTGDGKEEPGASQE